MGVDFLEFYLELERASGTTVNHSRVDWHSSKRVPPDITVGEMYDCIAGQGRPIGAKSCLSCRYDLRGLKAAGRCPECGLTYDVEAITRDEFFVILASSIGLQPDQLDEHQLMHRDLNMD